MDETIIKPRPGRMGRSSESVAPANDDPQKTVLAAIPENTVKQVTTPVSIFQNPLLEASSDCLSLVIYMNKHQHIDDIPALKQRCIDAIKGLEAELRGNELNPETIQKTRYCMCALIDESALNSNWTQGEWAKESLLSVFHKETFGGEYFYTLLDDALNNPNQNLHFLELQYHCFNLGFQGKLKLAKDGVSTIEDYRSRVYHLLSQFAGPIDPTLSPNWKERIAAGVELRNQFPLWVVFSLLGALGLFVYLLINMQLNNQVNDLTTKLDSIHPINNEVILTQKDKHFRILEQLLQTEIEKQVVTISSKEDRLRITLNNAMLFPSGTSELLPSVSPILAKLAMSLAGTKGKIQITGHTDNAPIDNEDYPSNWHLSLARATQVANFMGTQANLSGRLWPEGKGAAEPVASNDDAQSRAKNRRIEIDLLF